MGKGGKWLLMGMEFVCGEKKIENEIVVMVAQSKF